LRGTALFITRDLKAREPMTRTSNTRISLPSVLFALVFTTSLAQAADRSIVVSSSPESAAFARYVEALHEPDPFAGPGTIAFSITATVPELYKTATILAIRQPGDDDRGSLSVTALGDGAVLAEVVSRCLDLKAELYKLPVDALAIGPAHYKFRLAGEVNTGTGRAYRYDIVPRKTDDISITGYIWMDVETGREVMLVGHVKRAPKIDGPVSVVRDTKLLEDGTPIARITHLSFSVAAIGRAEVEISEYLSSPALNGTPFVPNTALAPERLKETGIQ
jgi:hypothetical protein